MKTRTLRKDKVNIITLGCSKNVVDSEVLSGQLKANDINVVHESKKSDHNIVVINTCGFIDKAKEESINTILDHVELKKKGRLDKVYVTGCLTERYRQNLEEEIPEVDAWFGTMELPLILKRFEADYKAELVGERLLSTPGHYAYMKISEGCNRTCSFCAIPLMRGQHVSKPVEQLVAEAEGLVRRGVKEIMLIAQELTYYGLDIYKKRELPRLLHALADVKGLEWIRLHYAYPSKFPLEIIDAIKERPNICNYLDMPLQHSSDKMLKAMRRQITKAEMDDLIGEIRNRIPGICLRTTLIAGFPGETAEDVEDMKGFLQQHRFDRVGIFTYSHEEGTSAYALEDNIPYEEKERRAQEVMEVQQEISYEKNQEKVDKIFKVLVDKKEAGRYLGRTEFDSVEVDNEVIITTSRKLTPGEFVNVKITSAYDYDLEGTVVEDGQA
ncbi:30S ribosomal protein S12 methylthiotransferase RimO [Agriterribacter sp.]|uniref:30S ribosomal protein S12 methylthiotransferase RimO n=1 Tax=Agriterribacter sp. TaxID=2821509 RepID=UPI002C8C17AD|nr:30S ribosomal protein S12 methylthiotransferase RimO [Agriterribacter sp.]HRO46633.1 30S ribosomal protein S12 methylthiotransferase RimO [Agriterribacter sp.]HRQ17293.1 30S ribosomal protein S12 methylthiotransferase RimO [Agriterribacter sp.]